jgi:ATP-dependent DNA ligase
VRYPDNPREVSVDFLAQLDSEPGVWIGSEKLCGRRRLVHFDGSLVTLQAKHKSEGMDVPPHLKAELICEWRMPVDGVTLDCEWVGNSTDGALDPGEHRIVAFDILRWDGKWLDGVDYSERLAMQTYLKIPWAKTYFSPDLTEAYYTQLTNPVSEGLVVRHKQQRIIMRDGRCSDNPLMLKVKHHAVNRVIHFAEGK